MESADTCNRVLDCVRRCYREHGVPPTVKEVGQALGITSTGVVHYHLKRLVQRGYLRDSGLGSARKWVPVGVMPFVTVKEGEGNERCRS